MTMRTLLGVAGIALALAGGSALLPAQSAAPDRPNVVLIMTDDAGYGDFGVYGASDIKTPHIDSLARDGVRLTDFYANGATCTPTRAGLISGRYQQRYALEAPLGVQPKEDAERGLPPSGRSLPQLLKGAGLCHRAGRQVAPRLEARVQPGRARLRLLLRLQERLHRLLPAHCRQGLAGQAGPVRERQAGRGGGLHDGPDHGSDRAGHRAEPREAVLHRRRLQRAALAVSAARPAVDGARQRPAPDALRHRDEHARRLRRDGGARRRRRRPHPRGAGPAGPAAAAPSSSSPTTTAANGCRTAARCSIARARCGRAGSACRRSCAGPGASRPAASPIRSA